MDRKRLGPTKALPVVECLVVRIDKAHGIRPVDVPPDREHSLADGLRIENIYSGKSRHKSGADSIDLLYCIEGVGIGLRRLVSIVMSVVGTLPGYVAKEVRTGIGLRARFSDERDRRGSNLGSISAQCSSVATGQAGCILKKRGK